MRKIILAVLLIVLSIGCSYKFEPSLERFEKTLKNHIGENRMDLGGVYKKVSDKTKIYYYISHFNTHIEKECKYILITDLNNIIIGYKILTPQGCKKLPTAKDWI